MDETYSQSFQRYAQQDESLRRACAQRRSSFRATSGAIVLAAVAIALMWLLIWRPQDGGEDGGPVFLTIVYVLPVSMICGLFSLLLNLNSTFQFLKWSTILPMRQLLLFLPFWILAVVANAFILLPWLAYFI